MRGHDEGSNRSFRALTFYLAIHFLFAELFFLFGLRLPSFHGTNPDCNPEILPTEWFP